MPEPAQATHTAPTIVPDPAPGLSRGEREEPPTRHASEAVKLRIAGVSCHYHVGFYADGRLCEVFIDIGKAGSGIRALASTVAILASRLLQCGCDVESVAEVLRHTDFQPAGSVTVDASVDIDHASSFVDALAQLLIVYKDGAPPLDQPSDH